jgi:hypothetical protein
MNTTQVDAKELCVRATHIMADGTLEDFEAVVHPDARNREDVDEPPASRGRGPSAFYATALWLRNAYAELRWDIHDIVADGDLVVLHATMSGGHTGPSSTTMLQRAPRRHFRPRARGSPPPRRTGFALRTVRSSNTGPTVTTSAPRCNSPGPRRRLCT